MKAKTLESKKLRDAHVWDSNLDTVMVLLGKVSHAHKDLKLDPLMAALYPLEQTAQNLMHSNLACYLNSLLSKHTRYSKNFDHH